MELICRESCCWPAAGDGWSPRAEDAVLHGCIPVVIQDDVDEVFAPLLDWSTFSIRIAEVTDSWEGGCKDEQSRCTCSIC